MPETPETLLQKWLGADISEAEAGRLLATLQNDRVTAERLLGHLHVDALLRDLAATGDILAPAEPVALPRVSQRRVWPAVVAWTAVAAAAAILGTVAFVRKATSVAGNAGSLKPAQAEETSKAVALLTRSTDAVWADAPPAALIEPGWLKLRSGLAQIEFFSGAQVVIEGPAELQVISPGEAFCPRGKLSAEVPPQARGFRIGTPKGTVVDLGTAFGLSIDGAGAEVHVFKGEVELHDRPGARARGLREGEAVASDGSGTWSAKAADPGAFAALHGAGARADELQHQRFESWKAAVAPQNADPTLLARFDFLEASGRRLANKAAARSVEDAAVIGAAWANGRWAEKSALEFRSLADRVRVAVPGEPEQLTLAAWVRVDALSRRYNSIFMSEGWTEGSIHWQILDSGAVRLGNHGGHGRKGADFDSPVVFNTNRFGQWMHVAVRVDGKTGRVSHFVDGRKTAELDRGTGPLFLRPGLAELGNWNTSTHADPTPIRHLSGAIDEFALHTRLLDDREIQAAAEIGRP